MNTDQSILVIKDFVASQMDGQPIPPAASPEAEKLQKAVAAILRSTPCEHGRLGLQLLDVIINRVRSSISAEIALTNAVSGGRQE